MSTVSEIVQDSKLRSMSAAGGDTGDGMDDLLNWNNLTYKMPVTNSVVSARNIKTYPADRASYSWGPGGTGRAGPMFFHLQAGEQYIDWGKSYLRFTLQHTPLCSGPGILNYGLGSACNFIETVIVTTRSGTEIHRCEQFNRWRAMQDRLTKPQHWFKQVGTMMGYTGDPDFNKILMCDKIQDSNASIDQFCLSEIATAGFTRSREEGLGEQSFEYLIPLDALGGPFATGQLSPAVLAGGLIIELRLAPYLQCFTGVEFAAPSNITTANATETQVHNMKLFRWTFMDRRTSVRNLEVKAGTMPRKIRSGYTYVEFKDPDGNVEFWDQCCDTTVKKGTPSHDQLKIQVGDFIHLDPKKYKHLRKSFGVHGKEVKCITTHGLVLKGAIDTKKTKNYRDFVDEDTDQNPKGLKFIQDFSCGLEKGEGNVANTTSHANSQPPVATIYDPALSNDDLAAAQAALVAGAEDAGHTLGDFTGLSGYIDGDMSHDPNTAPTISNISIHLDTHLLNDAAMRALTQTSASDGLEIVYEEAFHQQAGVQTSQIDIVCSKAVSRALRVFGGLYEPATNSLESDITRPIGLPEQYFWRLGSIFFPNTPVSSELVAYHNLLYALEQVDDKKYSSDISPVTFTDVFPVLCATFERSALLKYSGSAINNSRTLTVSARLPQYIVDEYSDEGLQFHFWLEHLAVAKTFLNNCIVSI